MNTILDRSEFDLWFLRKNDNVLFAASSTDHELHDPVPLYENGHTLLEGGHSIRIFVNKEKLPLDFYRMKHADMVVNTRTGSITVAGLTHA